MSEPVSGEIDLSRGAGDADPNRSARKFLEEYCDSTVPLNYAVMLSGRWGAGKTYFLKNFLRERNEPHLYISLYGVSSIADIEQQIFAQLHPFLASKGMRIAGLVAKALAKGTLKLDLDGDRKDDAALNLSLPEVKIAEFAKDASGRILVFDDLERAVMSRANVLGFINSFVEHEDMKAIIVANEEEIEKSDKDYKRVKEKLIGQTLKILPSLAGAYLQFSELIQDSWAKNVLVHNQDRVKSIFEKSGAENLRVLKQAMWDFERISSAFRQSDRGHTAEVLKILECLVALSIELRTGSLTDSDLREATQNPWTQYLGRNAERTPSAFDRAEDRYPDVDLRQSYLDVQLISELVLNGVVEATDIQESLDRASPFGAVGTIPAWRRAWHGFQSTDAEFSLAMSDFENDLNSLAYVPAGEVLHAFGILLLAARIGWHGYTPAKAMRRGKAYVDALASAGKVDIPIGRPAKLHTESGYVGLGFMELDNPNFDALREYYEVAIQKAWENNVPKVAAALLACLPERADAFSGAISISSGGGAEYWNMPVLHRIDPKEFVSALLSCSPNAQDIVLGSIRNRLTRGDAPEVVRVELPWLRKVVAEFRRRLPILGEMTRYRLRTRIKSQFDPLLVVPSKSAV